MRASEKSAGQVNGGFASLILLTVTFLCLYHSTFLGLARDWMSREDYTHGFLIVPLSLYLVWTRRRDMAGLPLRPSRLGIPFFLAWSVLFILGVGARISTFERVSLIVFLLGSVLSLAGRKYAGMVVFPILFLLFMIPIPSEIYSAVTAPLALLATSCAVFLMRLAELPVLQEGNLILMPANSLEVQDVCSGLRSLVSIMALALLVGSRIFSSFHGTLFLLLASVPVSIMGNIVRITVAGFFSSVFSPHVSCQGSHTVAGISALLFSLLLLLAAGGAIRWVERKRMQYISWYLR